MTATELETTHGIERHAQTVLVMLLVALLLWVGNTTQKTAVAVAEMKVELNFLKIQAMQPSPQYIEISKRIDNVSTRVNVIEAEVLKNGGTR